MKFKPLKRAPVILAVFVLALVCGVRLLHLDFFDRLERMTYDLRVRTALHFPAPAATNLAFVSMEDSSIAAVAATDCWDWPLSGFTGRVKFMAGSSKNFPRKAQKPSRLTCCSANCAPTIRRCRWPTAA